MRSIRVRSSERVPEVPVRWWRDRPGLVVAGVVFVVALLARLVPVLAGGGLTGVSYYDDGVYFGGALALVNGALPYRDFLLLHPPGVLLAGAPYALVGTWTTDGRGLALARLGWMVGGSLTAVLVTRLARPAGLAAAATAGLFLAVYYPQVRQDRSTLLEGVATPALALGIWLIVTALARDGRTAPIKPASPTGRTTALLVAGGMVLGVSPATKIVGIVVVLAVAGWVAASHRSRRAGGLVLGGAVASATAICLPFFVAAPAAMWRMVVVDQTGRPPLPIGVLARFDAIGGLTTSRLAGSTAADLIVIVVLAAALLLSWKPAPYRWAPTLLVVLVALMMITPSFFTYYAAALSVPLAVVLGLAVARVWAPVQAGLTRRTHRRLDGRARPGVPRFVTLLGLVVGVVAFSLYAAPLTTRSLGRDFPADRLHPAVRRLPGCVTADEPVTLILLDVFSRNVDRGCQVVVDLGGYSYDLPRGPGDPGPFPRPSDPIIQRHVMTYLASGEATLSTRFLFGNSLSGPSRTVLESWPVIDRVGRWVIRRPEPPR